MLVQRSRGSLMPGLWELPGLSGQEREAVRPVRSKVIQAVALQVGREVDLGKRLGGFTHTVVNRKVQVEVREGLLKGRRTLAGGAERKFQILRPGLDELPALTAAARKALAVAGLPPHAWITKEAGR